PATPPFRDPIPTFKIPHCGHRFAISLTQETDQQEDMMVQQAFNKDTDSKVFSSIKVGTAVYDNHDHHLGKVEDVYFGASSPTANERGTGSATAPAQDVGVDPLVNQIARGFDSDQLPEELRQRLLREGYLRISGEGLFGRARYVLPEQVASVTSD